MVSRSGRQLEQLAARLDTGIPGTAWAVDPVTNQVVRSSSVAELDSSGPRAVGRPRSCRARRHGRTGVRPAPPLSPNSTPPGLTRQ